MSAAFEVFASVVRSRSGLELVPERRDVLVARLMPLVRRLGLASLDALAEILGEAADDLLAEDVVAAMTSSDTAFFRDRALFAAVKASILPRLIALKSGTRRLRVWSAGCSTGQEIYSIAMLLHAHALQQGGWQIDLVGTDINARFLEKARAGLYSQFEVQRGLPVRLLLEHFTREDDGWRLSDAMRSRVTFERINLLDDPAELGAFDLILCRDVLGRFAAPECADTLQRLVARLAPAGVLALGEHEEPLGFHAGLVPLQEAPAAFRRPGPTLRLAVA